MSKEEIDKTIGEDLSEQIIKMENVYVDFVRKRDKEIERLNNIIKEKDEGIKALVEDLCEESEKIDKAVKYIEQHSNSFSVLDTISNAKLLSILKGSDSNE